MRCASRGAAQRELGRCHLALGRPAPALAHFEAALAIAHEIGDPIAEADARVGRSCVPDRRNDDADACRADLIVAVRAYRSAGNRRAEATALVELGLGTAEAGALDEARDHLASAVDASREIEDRRTEARALSVLGGLYLERADLDAANATLQEALVAHRAVGDRPSEGIASGYLGMVVERRGDPEGALGLFRAAIAAARAAADQAAEGRWLGKIALLHAREGRGAEAAQHIASAQQLIRSSNEPILLAEILADRTEAHHLLGDDDSARSSLAEARAQIGTTPNASAALRQRLETLGLLLG